MPRRIKLVLEYDGTDFHGWQAQTEGAGRGPAPTPPPLYEGRAGTPALLGRAGTPAPPVRTVQGALEAALKALTGAAIRAAGASRTDAGVHAAGQVASFDLPDGFRLPPERLTAALNAHLPRDVCVLRAAEAPADFHARFSARGKLYRYSILARRPPSPLLARTHWHVRGPLDVAAMREAARCLTGTHDFAAFANELAAGSRGAAPPEGEGQVKKLALPCERSTVREVFRVEISCGPAVLGEALSGGPNHRDPGPGARGPDTEGGGLGPGARGPDTEGGGLGPGARGPDTEGGGLGTKSGAPDPACPRSGPWPSAPDPSCQEVWIEIAGSGFLYKMVRTIAGSLVEVGRGAREPEWLAEALASRDRRRAGPTAPPHGLCLIRVFE